MGQLKDFMDSASIDYRDCLEKRELVKRLEDHLNYLPLHLKVRLPGSLAGAAAFSWTPA